MKIPSNKIKDIRRYMHAVLKDLYPTRETDVFLEQMLIHFAKIKKTDLYINPDMTANESTLLKINKGIKKLKIHTPIDYIIGHIDFLGLKINVTPSVLIPRPETEELVDTAIKHLHSLKNKSQINVLDAATGSGVIALAIKKHCHLANMFAFDISKDAIEVSKNNASINGLSVNFFHDDLLNFSSFDILPDLDIIISNPPYVRESEKKLMSPNVLEHEPTLALFVADENPLIFYKALAKISSKKLKQGGHFYFEINEALGKSTSDIFRNSEFEDIRIIKDINDKDRFIFGIKS